MLYLTSLFSVGNGILWDTSASRIIILNNFFVIDTYGKRDGNPLPPLCRWKAAHPLSPANERRMGSIFEYVEMQPDVGFFRICQLCIIYTINVRFMSLTFQGSGQPKDRRKAGLSVVVVSGSLPRTWCWRHATSALSAATSQRSSLEFQAHCRPLLTPPSGRRLPKGRPNLMSIAPI